MKRSRLVLTIASLLLIMILCTGCGNKPSGEPQVVLEQYMQNITNGDYESSYNLLSVENQKQISLTEFKDWQYITNQIYKSGTFNIINKEEVEDYSYNGIEYPYAVKFKVSCKDYNYMTEKDIVSEGEKIIVAENSEWKVLDEESYRVKYAWAVDCIGRAYIEGKTFDRDLNSAITCFLKAIEICPDYTGTYYSIAYAYDSKSQYDKALEYTNIGIEKEKDDILLSDLYNMKGTILQAQNKLSEAKSAYQKALELDSNNVYATDNLANLQ